MGGHGGLNILPQKRWNVYNYENREKVRRDEEAAAKEEQLKREQSRKRDAELRLEKLRQARGLSNSSTQAETGQPFSTSTQTPAESPKESESDSKHINLLTPAESPKESESDSKHINLFEGIKIFDPIKAGDGGRAEKKGKFWRDNNINGNKKVKREEQVKVVNPEDEKYRMGYGVAGKGVKLPWYMEKRRIDGKTGDSDKDYDEGIAGKDNRKGAGGKKSLEELRDERLKRERMEKEREKALVKEKSRSEGGFSARRR